MYNLFLTHHTHSWPGQHPHKPTKTHSSQRWPMQAHEDEKGPKRCQMPRLGHRYIFFQMYNLFLTPTTPIVGLDDTHKSPRRPTAANEGQHDDNDKPCRLVVVAPVHGCLSI